MRRSTQAERYGRAGAERYGRAALTPVEISDMHAVEPPERALAVAGWLSA